MVFAHKLFRVKMISVLYIVITILSPLSYVGASNWSEVPIYIREEGKSRLEEFIFFEPNIVILLIKPTSRSAHFGDFTLQISRPPPCPKEQFLSKPGGSRKHAKTSIKFVVKHIYGNKTCSNDVSRVTWPLFYYGLYPLVTVALLRSTWKTFMCDNMDIIGKAVVGAYFTYMA